MFSKTSRGTTVIWHDGNKMTNTQLRRYVDEGVVIIITTNSEQHPADQEMSKIGELVFGKQ